MMWDMIIVIWNLPCKSMQIKFRLQILKSTCKTYRINVPNPLRFEVDPKTVSMILNVIIHTIYTDCSHAYHTLRHVLYCSAAKSEKETSQLAVES